MIQGNIEGILDGIYAPDRANLDAVLEETRVMARLLDDMRTLSTAEAGALRLHRESIDGELVADSIAAFQPRADSAGVTISPRVAAELPPIDGDPVRIGEVLSNLLLNALNHTSAGGSIVCQGRGPATVASLSKSLTRVPASRRRRSHRSSNAS